MQQRTYRADDFCAPEHLFGLKDFAKVLLEKRSFQYVLLGKVNPSPQRCDLAGATKTTTTTYISLREFCRRRKEDLLCKLNLAEVTELFHDDTSAERKSETLSSCVQEGIVRYVDGYIAGRMLKKVKCESCWSKVFKAPNIVLTKNRLFRLYVITRPRWRHHPRRLVFLLYPHLLELKAELFDNRDAQMEFLALDLPETLWRCC